MVQVLLAALVVQLPFEFRIPLLTIGNFAVTNLELTLYALVLVAMVRAIRANPPFDPLDWALLACAGSWIVAGLAAPWQHDRALLAGGRMASGPLLAILLRHEHQSASRPRLFSLICMLGLTVAGIGLLEFLSPTTADSLLSPFRLSPTWSPYGRRAAGPFEHANQLGAFLELALLISFAFPGRPWSWPVRAALVTGLLLTLSRSSWLGAAAGSVTAWALFRHPGSRVVRWSVRAIALTAIAGVIVFSVPSVRLRLFGWAVTPPLSVQFRVPEDPPARLLLTNTGTMAWHRTDANATMIILQAINPDGSQRTGVFTFDRTVAPGETWALTFNADRIPPGRYRQRYDLWHPVFGYASQWGATPLEGILTRRAGLLHFTAVPGATSGGFDLATRPQLWRAAWSAFRERPLWGIGPGQFQHYYGRWIPGVRQDSTLHANHLYLGLLAETGVIGLAGFLAVILAAGFMIMRQHTGERRSSAGALGALAAWSVHGFFDTFVHFNGVSLTFWIIVSTCAVSRKR